MRVFTDSERQKMLTAQLLIREERYQEAKNLIQGIKHPTADDWRRKLDKRIATQKGLAPTTSPTVAAQRRGCLWFIVVIVILTGFCSLLPQLLNGSSSGGSSGSSSGGRMTDQEVRDQLATYIPIHAPLRRIDSIRYDGHRVTVVYRSTASTEAGKVDEWLDLFDAVEASYNNRFTLTSVSLFIHTPSGISLAEIDSSFRAIQQYKNGNMTRIAFIGLLTVTTF